MSKWLFLYGASVFGESVRILPFPLVFMGALEVRLACRSPVHRLVKSCGHALVISLLNEKWQCPVALPPGPGVLGQETKGATVWFESDEGGPALADRGLRVPLAGVTHISVVSIQAADVGAYLRRSWPASGLGSRAKVSIGARSRIGALFA